MPGLSLGWLFGIWLFQQQAHLWTATLWLACIAGLTLCYCLACRWSLGWRITHGGQSRLHCGAWVLLSILLGFAWAQGRAVWRLHDALPAACELQVVRVQASLIGVP